MTALFELQTVPLQADISVRDIYQLCHDGAKLETGPAGLKRIDIPRGSELNLDTYYGSFYESYWLRYTGVKEFAFCFRLSGAARFRMFRNSPELGTVLVREMELKGSDETHTVTVPAPGAYPTMHGRLYVQFVSRADGTRVDNLCWRTATPPKRNARLEVTTCTFRRDKELALTLAALDDLQKEGLVKEITVINHDAPGIQERLASFMPDHAKGMAMNIVDQANTGSAGGMTRGIIEAVDRGTCDYLLRLDDDIRVDPLVLRRLPILLNYVNDNVALGGHMLDGLKPCALYEAGAVVLPDELFFTTAAPHVNITSTQGLNHFARVDFIDYNAWWFFAVAVKSVAKDFLVIPFFLYLDDIEYALRLKQAHIDSVSWPGIAVWHEPFYTKVEPYKLYYRYRNVMLTYEYHNCFNRRSALRVLFTAFRNSMLQFYYHRAWALVKAMEDFVKGPEVMAKWTPEAHKALIAEEKLWAYPDLPRSASLPRAHLTGRAPRWKWLWNVAAVWRLLGDMIRPGRPSAPVMGVDYKTQWHIWAAKGQDNLAVNHDRADVYHVYRRDPAKVRQLVFRFVRAALAIAFSSIICKRKAAMDRLTTDAFWRSKLGVKPLAK